VTVNSVPASAADAARSDLIRCCHAVDELLIRHRRRLGSGTVVEVRHVVIDDADEAWERVTDEPDTRGVEAVGLGEMIGWQVIVAVMEFVREEPLEGELRRRIAAALRSVDGVESAGEEDREVWFVTGTPSGQALVRAAAAVVDDLADRTRGYAAG
jgi:hypothetical protein